MPAANMPALHTDRRTLMDKRGDGVPIILKRSIERSGKRPKYKQIGDAELMLTIFAANPTARSAPT